MDRHSIFHSYGSAGSSPAVVPVQVVPTSSMSSGLPITLAGIPMGTTGPGQNSLQFVMFSPTPVASTSAAQSSSLPRILPAPTPGFRSGVLTLTSPKPLVATLPPALPDSATQRVAQPGKFNALLGGPSKLNGHNKGGNSAGGLSLVNGSQNQAATSSMLVDVGPIVKINQHPYVDPEAEEDLILSQHKKRGRKKMSDAEKAASKRKREKLRDAGSSTTKKGQRGRPSKKSQNKILANNVNDMTKEINDLKQKIRGRYETKKKPNVKKEDAGYFGPYIKAYDVPEPSGTDGKVPVPNFIVDNFDCHLGLPTHKSKLSMEKPTGITLEGPFVCFFCHLDPNSEREISMGGLIGPIILPEESGKKHGEKAYVYAHEPCLEWSSNFRMMGFEIVDLPGLFEDAKTVCSVCKRKGATIGCSSPFSCTKAFHFPCAKMNGFKFISESHQVFCDKHKDAAATKKAREEESDSGDESDDSLEESD